MTQAVVARLVAAVEQAPDLPAGTPDGDSLPEPAVTRAR